MNILVCGGAGFIGANFIWYLNKNYPNDKITCVDLMTYAANLNNIQDLIDSNKCSFVCADICNKKKVEEIFKCYRPDIVVNFAAETHVDRAIVDSSKFIHSNIFGVQVLLDCCNKYGVHLHQVSTDEVYGDLPLDSTAVFSESSPLKPSNPYSASKAAADLLIMAYYRTYKTSVTITRCSNNFGRFQHCEKFIPATIKSVYNNQPVKIFGNGKNMRSWLSVNDNCSAIDLVMRKGRAGEIYNVCGDIELQNIHLVEIIAKIIDKKAEIMFVEDRKGHDLRYPIDSTKITEELGFELKTYFNAELEKTVEWYLNYFKK